MGQDKKKAKAGCWGYFSEEGTACVLNASCSVFTEIVTYALQEELIFNYSILCICSSLIKKEYKQKITQGKNSTIAH